MKINIPTHISGSPLSDEARAALRLKGPSDNRLLQILNSSNQAHAADDKLQRWMAAQILVSRGFTLATTK